MAKGRKTVHRRKTTQTARNQKPRASSPEGNKLRAEKRASHTPVDPADKKLHYHTAGSRNPRKVSR